jgi:hypothetical protein
MAALVLDVQRVVQRWSGAGTGEPENLNPANAVHAASV